MASPAVISNILGSDGLKIPPSAPKEDLMTRLKSEVYKRRIRVKEFFFDFDHLRKGTITEDKFRSALSMLNIFMTEQDINDLITRYRDREGLINYVEFSKSLDDLFLDDDKAKEILSATQFEKKIQKNPEIQNILQAYRHTIKTKRIFLKQHFQDFDRTKSSHITVDQFSRVLNTLKILPPPQVFQILVDHYKDNGINSKEVNYVKFCEDVDDMQEMLVFTMRTQKYNENNENRYSSNDLVENVADVNLLQTLYVPRKLMADPSLSNVEKKIQAEVVMRQIRIKEFFKDYDPLRKGVVTESQFKRILNINNFNLVPVEIDSLLTKYKEQDGRVNYFKFCETIDEIFTHKEIDKDPLFKVPQIDKTTTLPARRKFLQFTEQEQEKLESLMLAYRREIANKRALIKPHFQDFDKTKQGYISKNQFLRILYQFGLYPDEQSLNLILRRYIDKGNLDEVNYYEFCRDVDIYDEGVQISEGHASAFKTYKKSEEASSNAFIHNDIPNDLQDLLAKLRKKAYELRVRISEFLRDFDKLRSGSITKNQLRLGLNMANMPLSNQEFEMIAEYFKNSEKEDHISWKQFCDCVDEVFTIKNLEKQSPSTLLERTNLSFNYGKSGMTQSEVNLAEAIKRKFKAFCTATRLDIKQFFQDWDRLGRNKVSPKQFRQVLATVNFPLSDDEFNSIVKLYYSDDQKDVRYVDFIKDTQPTNEFTSSNKSKEKLELEPHQQQRASLEHIGLCQKNPQKSVEEIVILNKIKTAVKINRLRMNDYLKDYDPLKKGILPANKFRGILSAMKIDLTEPELILAEKMYQYSEDPSKVDYSKFKEDIDIIFTKAELEKDPLGKPEVYIPPFFLDPKDELTPEEEDRLHKFMIRLGEVVRKHRILLKPHFQDKDKARSGKVSFPRFRAVLDFHKLPLKDEEYRLLCKRFAHHSIEFNYVEFDEILKKYEKWEG